MVLFWASTTIFPFQVFITLHLHYGDSIYLCFQSSCSLIYLLHCHIFFFFFYLLLPTFQWLLLPTGQSSYSLASHTMVFIIWLSFMKFCLHTLGSWKKGYLQFTWHYFLLVHLGSCWSPCLESPLLLAPYLLVLQDMGVFFISFVFMSGLDVWIRWPFPEFSWPICLTFA